MCCRFHWWAQWRSSTGGYRDTAHTMSQENVNVVRSFFRAWAAGNPDAAYDFFHPDVIMRMEGDWPEPGPYVGREAVMRWDAQFRDTWDSMTVQTVIHQLHTGDRVVGRYALHGEGRGPATNLEVTIIHTVREGKIRDVEFHWDHEEALAALGLAE